MKMGTGASTYAQMAFWRGSGGSGRRHDSGGTAAVLSSGPATARSSSSAGATVPVLDPHVRYDWSTRMMQQSVYDALVEIRGQSGEIKPWLAERWETSADGKTWTFHLVGNAKFHNGDPVDAEAVRYSFERGLKLNKGVAWMLKDFLDPAGIEAVDAHTVRFNLKQPYSPFLVCRGGTS